MAASLPEEVLERLSVVGAVKLSTGTPEQPVHVDATVAPLRGQLYALFPRNPRVEAAFLATGRVVLRAEDGEQDWSVRVEARAVAGRTVSADARRAELMYWLPEGANANITSTVRLHAESVDYVRGRGEGRVRAAGPVPGGAPPPPLQRFSRLASDGALGLFVVMAAINWLSAFFLFEPGLGQLFFLACMLTCGGALVGGTVLWMHAAAFTRWREGTEPDPRVAVMLEGWEPHARVQGLGVSMIAVGAVIALFLLIASGLPTAFIAVLSSGAPVLIPFHGLRHALRRSDAAGDRRNS